MYTTLRQRKSERIDTLQKSLDDLRLKLHKEFTEVDHPRDKDGQFTSGSGGGDNSEVDSKDSKSKSETKTEENKPSAGLIRTVVGLIVGVKGAGLTAGLVGALLLTMGIPIAPVIAAAGIAGLVVGRGLYNAITKSEGLKFKTEEAAKKFLAELPKHLSEKQLAELHTKLQAKAKELGIK